MPRTWTKTSLAKTIDHTLLKAVGTEAQVRELCAEARALGFASVCVNPVWVPLCARELAGSGVLVCTVIGFPLGANCPETKAAEARLAVSQGAAEVDMVMNLGAAKAGDWDRVEADIRTVVQAAGEALVKVILETCYLTDDEKIRACQAARAGGRPLRQDQYGLRDGGRNGGGHPPHAEDRGRPAPGEGLGGRAHLPGRPRHARGRGRPDRGQLGPRHRAGTGTRMNPQRLYGA